MKKGQGGYQAAILVAVIGAFIALYIVLLPDSQRQELLREGPGTGQPGGYGPDQLFYERPGRLLFFDGNAVEHSFPQNQLFTVVETEVFRRVPSLVISRTLVTNGDKNTSFRVVNPDLVQGGFVTFSVKEGEGVLSVVINGQEVYTGSPSGTVSPIAIPAEIVANQNTVVFEVSRPSWWKVWGKNTYVLEDVQFGGEIRDVSAQIAENAFFVSSVELERVESARLRFTPDCNPRVAQELFVTVNEVGVFGELPVCGQLHAVELNPTALRAGENTLVFRSQSDYRIGAIAVVTDLTEPPSYRYSFDIAPSEFDDILNGFIGVEIIFRFGDARKPKEAELFINGDKTYVPRITGPEYRRFISQYLTPGRNSLNIIPLVDMDVEELEIRFV